MAMQFRPKPEIVQRPLLPEVRKRPETEADAWPDEHAPVVETHFEGAPFTPLVQVIEHVGRDLTMRYEARKPGRPKSGKTRVTMLLDPAVIAKFKATGDGWQARMNDALRDAKL